jgi:hypothetical protein
VLSDSTRAPSDRMQAAFRLSRDARVDDSLRMELCLNRELPELARYLLAEAVSTGAVARDPRSFALTVARSPDWPDWLRLLLTRPLAVGAGRGFAIPREALDELAAHSDPMVRLWAVYAQAAQGAPDPRAVEGLKTAARDPSDRGALAAALLAALRASDRREDRLHEASLWLRRHHPQAAQIWQGWDEVDGRVVPVATKR